MNTDTRKIRAAGIEQGEIPLRRLFTLRTRGELAEPVEFYSVMRGAWLPIAGIMWDIEPAAAERMAAMRAAGVRRVQILGSGTGEDCPACAALDGKDYTLDTVPALPPPDCACVPWCRSLIIAVSPEEDPGVPVAAKDAAGKQPNGGCLSVILIGVILVTTATFVLC